MKRFLLMLPLMLGAGLALAGDFYYQTVTLSSGTAVTVTQNGPEIVVQCTGPVKYILCAHGATCTAVNDATAYTLTNFDLPVSLCMPGSYDQISLIRTGSTSITCSVGRAIPSALCHP